jgi:Domain of unknown function (DUF2383)
MQNVTTIEKLLKDEMSATVTYQKALEELNFPGGKFMTDSITPMLGDHKAAVSLLQEQMVKLGGTPPRTSSTWGTWPELVLENADLLGKRSALKVLIDGEIKGESYYTDVLKDPTLSADFRALIETKLLPNQQLHIRSLDRVMDAIPA